MIVGLNKVTLYGFAEDKAAVLAELQDFGCLHLLPLREGHVAPIEGGPAPEATEALKFLLSSPQRARQVTRGAEFDAQSVQDEALALRARLQGLEDEREALEERIAALAPWGDFELPELGALDGLRLWFYVVPHFELDTVEAATASAGLSYAIVNRDARFSWVVVLASEEPEGMPVQRTRTGYRALHTLEARRDEVELAITDAEAQRARLSRWGLQLAQSLARLEDAAAQRRAAEQTLDAGGLFALQAWAPKDRLPGLHAYAETRGLALEASEPESGESPPTLLRNPQVTNAGEALVQFYMTPGYWSWDPSATVLVSFALFFGMILSDVGYAALLALAVALAWRRMGRSDAGRRVRRMFVALVGATVVYGALVGSYFGLTPSPGSLLDALRVLDLEDADRMMLISVVVGVSHIVLANLSDAARFGWQARALAPLGWAGIVSGAFALALGRGYALAAVENIGLGVLVLGALLVLAFTGAGLRPLPRLGHGLLAFTRITTAFGDVLSYLRLFALGLATASLAMAFNDMAAQVRDAVPGAGLLLALVVLVLGHGLNFVLGVASGFVHGLRLNVIEFFNWALPDEGKRFHPFRRKEATPWNP